MSDRDRTRVETLDGLRGVAAFVVLLTHVAVASMPTLERSLHAEQATEFPSLDWWLVDSPAQILWSGQAAVLTFFVLSGYVLALPYVRGARFSAPAYYAKRLLRLYLPVWGALLFAFVLYVAVDRRPFETGTDWLNQHAVDLSMREVAHGVLLLFQPGGPGLTTVLWTLKWEVLFSLLLPLYLLVARRASGGPAAALVAVACVVVMLTAAEGLATFLPCFMLGTLLAFERGLLARTARLLAAHLWLRVLLPAAAVMLMTVGWWVDAEPRVSHVCVTLGAALAVVLAITHGGVGRLLRTQPVRWAGRRSFSLYLIHEPIVVALAFTLRDAMTPLLLFALAVPLALLAADLFFRAVEHPSHRLSRWAGRAVSRGG